MSWEWVPGFNAPSPEGGVVVRVFPHAVIAYDRVSGRRLGNFQWTANGRRTLLIPAGQFEKDIDALAAILEIKYGCPVTIQERS